MRNLNQVWVFYRGGIAIAMTWEWTEPLGSSYRAEFTAFVIASFANNSTTIKARIPGTAKASGF